MAGSTGYGNVRDTNLVFHFDVNDLNSFGGPATTNLLEDTALYNYNNVPGSVRTNLIKTGEKFRGAFIWEQNITALDGSGASWLSNGSNPGIGVYTGGGGGTANRFTGHSIFFKPTVAMNGCPIYTNYSNIGGWQSNCNYEYVGDGWYRAYVVWYNTVTQGDGKYWAINPLSTSVGQTVKIYWAGPFKEDLNLNIVSQYVQSSRSATQGLRDLANNYTISNINNVSFTANGGMTFDGTNDYIEVGSGVGNFGTSPFTISGWWKSSGAQANYTSAITQGFTGGIGNGGWAFKVKNLPGENAVSFSIANGYESIININTNGQPNDGLWHQIGMTRSGTSLKFYMDGAQVGDATIGAGQIIGTGATTYIGWTPRDSTSLNGTLNQLQIYNVALDEREMYRLYAKYKTEYSAPNQAFGKTPDNYATSGYQIRQVNPSATDGWYWINPQNVLASPLYVYVNFSYRSGEAWVLAASNRINNRSLENSTFSLDGARVDGTQSYAQFNNLINYVNYKGNYGGNSLDFNFMLPIKSWKYFSTDANKQVAQFVSSSIRTISDTGNHTKRYRWGFSDMNSQYAFIGANGISDETGTGAPGMYSYHAANSFVFAAYDFGNGSGCPGCPSNYLNAPFWYGCCWSGNIWGGGGGGGYADAYFWDGSGGDYHNYGAVYLKS